MKQHATFNRFSLAVLLSVVAAVTGLMLRSRAAPSQNETTNQANVLTGRVVSAAAGAVDPGHPVPQATVYLVPVTAIDTTTRMVASAIYTPPYPAEAYDEPLGTPPTTSSTSRWSTG